MTSFKISKSSNGFSSLFFHLAGIPDPSPTFSVRLSGGSSQWEGVVEIYHQDSWGQVCVNDYTWSEDNANTVCLNVSSTPPSSSSALPFQADPPPQFSLLFIIIIVVVP